MPLEKSCKIFMQASLGAMNGLLFLLATLAAIFIVIINPFNLFIGYFLVCLLVLFTLVMSAFGILATFDKTSIRPYALFSIAVSILTAYLCYEISSSYDDQHTHYLKRDMSQYDWGHKDKDLNPETSRWDSIQFDKSCCGVDRPEDWFSFKDPALKELLPGSCCSKYSANRTIPYFKFCEASPTSEHYTKGCYGDRFKVSQYADYIAYLPVVQFLLGFYALTIDFCNKRGLSPLESHIVMSQRNVAFTKIEAQA